MCVEAFVRDGGARALFCAPRLRVAPPPPQTKAPKSCPLHPPEGLQQDAELLGAAQRKHGDQHLQGGGEASVGGALATLLTQVELM